MLSLERLHAASLRRTLLSVLLPGMVLVVCGELWLTWRTALDAANAAYDRSLLGAIKAMDANISTDSGGLGVELPYRMLEFFELTASGQVFYRVATEDGLVEIGNADLPPPPRWLPSGRAAFTDALYLDQPLRLGSYARELDRPIGPAGQPGVPQRVVIQIGETVGSRRDFTRALVMQALARDLLMLTAGGILLALAIAWALRPLGRLRQEVASRLPEDLRPVSATGIPADVRPLVEAINQHVARNRELAQARRSFIDDASHQLRTPLATMSAQVGFALRESDPQRQREALQAIRAQLEETVRRTNQMLSLARADSAGLLPEPVDAAALADAVTRQTWPLAREQGIDLGLELPSDGRPAGVLGDPAWLREALSNLLHNALRHTPGGGQVTVRVELRAPDEVWIGVLDSGPGMPADEIARAGERFFRGRQAAAGGSGLGLAIVKAIVQRHGGRLELHSPGEAGGLTAAIVLPRAPDA